MKVDFLYKIHKNSQNWSILGLTDTGFLVFYWVYESLEMDPMTLRSSPGLQNVVSKH